MAQVSGLDWSKLQSLALVAEHGSISAAARASGASQPTLSRHIASLEEEIGLRLFDRTSEGLTLTATGAEICSNVAEMQSAAYRVDMIANGRSQEISGSVRITASDTVACYSLPPILTELRQAEPRISIELVASNETNNLLKREADIAVRMFRPTQNDVIAKKVGELSLGFAASKDYLDARGRPKAREDLLQHDVVGFDKGDDMIDGFKGAGLVIDRNFFPLRTDALFTHLQFARAGYGVALIQTELVDEYRELELVLADMEIPKLEFWLTAHAELRTSARIRRVYDFLAEKLAARFG